MKHLKLSYSEVAEDLFFDTYKEYVSESLGKIYGFNDSETTMLKNKSKLISNIEIEQILELLHPDYGNLGLSIDVHKNKLQTFLKWLNPFGSPLHYQIFKGAYRGRFGGNHNNRRIDIFAYNYKPRNKKYETRNIKLLIVNTLLHEVRHAYQMVHKEDKYMTREGNFILGGETGYSSQWVERDANAFAQRMMNNNKEKINEILNIDFDWDCTWGKLVVDF